MNLSNLFAPAKLTLTLRFFCVTAENNGVDTSIIEREHPQPVMASGLDQRANVVIFPMARLSVEDLSLFRNTGPLCQQSTRTKSECGRFIWTR